MLQIDGNPINKCTCFMYMDHTPNAVKLLETWKQAIVSTKAGQNQVSLGGDHEERVALRREGAKAATWTR